jgi:hypothetical protein
MNKDVDAIMAKLDVLRAKAAELDLDWEDDFEDFIDDKDSFDDEEDSEFFPGISDDYVSNYFA